MRSCAALPRGRTSLMRLCHVTLLMLASVRGIRRSRVVGGSLPNGPPLELSELLTIRSYLLNGKLMISHVVCSCPLSESVSLERACQCLLTMHGLFGLVLGLPKSPPPLTAYRTVAVEWYAALGCRGPRCLPRRPVPCRYIYIHFILFEHRKL